MSEQLSKHKRLILEVVVLLLLVGAGSLSTYAWSNYEYGQGYINGHADGYHSGYREGYKQGRYDGYQQGYSDGYSINQQASYNAGMTYIECWVIQNHPIVYSIWFDNAFSGVTC